MFSQSFLNDCDFLIIVVKIDESPRELLPLMNICVSMTLKQLHKHICVSDQSCLSLFYFWDQNNCTVATYSDLMEVFDTLNTHIILLNVEECFIGIAACGSKLLLINSFEFLSHLYLSHRGPINAWHITFHEWLRLIWLNRKKLKI